MFMHCVCFPETSFAFLPTRYDSQSAYTISRPLHFLSAAEKPCIVLADHKLHEERKEHEQ